MWRIDVTTNSRLIGNPHTVMLSCFNLIFYIVEVKNQELKTPGNSKTVVAVPDFGGAPAAIRRAQEPR